MQLTREQLKDLAVSAMKKVDVYPPFIKQFIEQDKVTMYIAGIGYTIDERTEDGLLRVIQSIEAEGNKLVYAVTKNAVGGDMVYALLLVTSEDEEDTVISEFTVDGIPAFEVFSYCYNADCDYCSEYGYITVQNRYGGIRRIG